MKITIFTASPNKNGLTAACGESAANGAKQSGIEVRIVDLNSYHIGKCSACWDGYGTCRKEHYCQVKDDFQGVHAEIADSDLFAIITPVYFGEMSESAKAFFDRLRRCEVWREGGNIFTNKPTIAVAAAGGSGNGTVSCLEMMERLLKHFGADIFDLITITKKSRLYKLDAIRESVKSAVTYVQQ